jgi:hypothetical protein
MILAYLPMNRNPYTATRNMLEIISKMQTNKDLGVWKWPISYKSMTNMLIFLDNTCFTSTIDPCNPLATTYSQFVLLPYLYTSKCLKLISNKKDGDWLCATCWWYPPHTNVNAQESNTKVVWILIDNKCHYRSTIAGSCTSKWIFIYFWKNKVRLSKNEFLNFCFLAKNQ